ncbi:hypothetical protein JWS13_39205 [Rhodococcus pseudokoreensis]|uniref:Minor tail protein n=1 Tax=Rhodococcus pseudokoreensis TaxID=2811421 RepID=A0A974WAS5_9NOCA|nr:hypothetical protein [Rhodococcus pseudokoreensis]QSE94204.1 hypothetical protein JWS13_39205 [Rhodococcus pseudokoreensis]
MAGLLDWLDTFGLGAIILALLLWIRNLRKDRAETGKLDAEAAHVIADAAAGLVGPLSERVGRMEQRIDVLEEENARKTKLLDSAIRFIRELLAWIERHVPDHHPPTIPADLESEIER